jgi:hypothetical protein
MHDTAGTPGAVQRHPAFWEEGPTATTQRACTDLEKFVTEFDNVIARGGRGETEAARRSVRRIAGAWIDTAKAYQKVL